MNPLHTVAKQFDVPVCCVELAARFRHVLQFFSYVVFFFNQCPHSLGCPRFNFDTIPCNFEVKYKNFQLKAFPDVIRQVVRTDRYSYMIFKKG